MLVLLIMFASCENLFMDLSRLPGLGLINSGQQFFKLDFISHSDSSLFLRWTPKGYTFLLVYVDDMIISGNDTASITYLKHHLTCHFIMKDLGPLTYFLGLEFVCNKSGIRVLQHKYETDLITSARLDDAHTFDMPL